MLNFKYAVAITIKRAEAYDLSRPQWRPYKTSKKGSYVSYSYLSVSVEVCIVLHAHFTSYEQSVVQSQTSLASFRHSYSLNLGRHWARLQLFFYLYTLFNKNYFRAKLDYLHLSELALNSEIHIRTKPQMYMLL